MKPNFSKIRILYFTTKTDVPNYQYRLGNSLILQTNYVKDLGVHTDCEFYFQHYAHVVIYVYKSTDVFRNSRLNVNNLP
jgi:hypothetical protein